MTRRVLSTYRLVIGLVALLMFSALLFGSGGLNVATTSAKSDAAFCSSDQLLSQSLKEDPSLQDRMEEQETAIRNYLRRDSDNELKEQGTTPNFIIPVVVYIVHSGVPVGTAENISEQQVNSQIAALNNAFSGRGVQFCLARSQGSTILPGSPTPGIIRIQSPLTNHFTNQEGALKALSTLPSDKYLRIYVVKDIDNNSGVVGYARFPGTVPANLDGIVMRYDVFGDVATCGCSNLLPNYDQGKVLAHEVGHYLYLYHTFHGGCSGVFPSDCAALGDRVCDTPQIAAPNTGCPTSPVASCNSTLALLNNEMDYTNDTCRNAFTTGQDSRMLATLNTFRQQLISSANLVYTGVQCAGLFPAAFSASNYNSCTNQNVTFDALNVAGATYSWDFGDNSTGTGDPAIHTYTTPGTYTVSLTVTDSGTSVSSTQQVFVTACSPINSSQGNWYFGRNAALKFNTGAPVAALDNGIDFTEACVTQSDAAGNLLFYSNSVNVFGANHVQMPSVAQLSGDPSASNGAISIPDPGNPNRYYLVYRANIAGPRLSYTIVNFGNVLNPFGELLSVDTVISSPSFVGGEQVTAVPNCAGTGYWVIAHAMSPQSAFYVYSLTASGISFSAAYPGALPSSIGILKASPDGTMLAQTGQSHDAALFNFDRATGAITLRSNLSVGNAGCSFSPDSKVLYTAGQSSFGVGIYQYDLTAPNPNATVQVVTDSLVGAYGFVTLQLGPDKKIYASQWGNTGAGVGFLPVINYPNQLNTPGTPNACGYNLNGPSLQGRNTYIGLPNMIDALPAAQIPADFSYAISSCSTVNFSTASCGSYAWNFGDGITSTSQNPTHTYAASGTYQVTLTLNGSTIVSRTIALVPPPAATISGPTRVCPRRFGTLVNNYSVNAQPGLLYNWTATNGVISGVSNSNNVDIEWFAFPGTVQLTVTDPATGCSRTSTLTVTKNCTILPPPHTCHRRVYDFDGDNRTDFTTLAIGSTGSQITWKVKPNPTGLAVIFPYGTVGDSITPSDFVSGVETDVSIWRAGTFYTSSVFPPFPDPPFGWGTTGDNAGRDGDYDGDGKDNPTVIRVVAAQLYWFIKDVGVVQFGGISPGFTTLAFQGADFTGDGREELVICRVNNATGQATWLIGDSFSGTVILNVDFGNFNTDYLIEPDDYSGDCRADLVVWRGGGTGPDAGAWYIRDTVTTNLLPVVVFGIPDPNFINNDLPLRGDYDGDGKADIAVFRPITREWFWIKSSNSTPPIGYQQFGDPNDTPLPTFFTF